MRLYYPDPQRLQPGAYLVPASPAPLRRLNRIAAGMSAADARKKRRTRHETKLSGDVLILTVRGTLDPLAGHRLPVEPVVCTCCGRKGDKLALKTRAASRGVRALRLKALKLNPARLP